MRMSDKVTKAYVSVISCRLKIRALVQFQSASKQCTYFNFLLSFQKFVNKVKLSQQDALLKKVRRLAISIHFFLWGNGLPFRQRAREIAMLHDIFIFVKKLFARSEQPESFKVKAKLPSIYPVSTWKSHTYVKVRAISHKTGHIKKFFKNAFLKFPNLGLLKLPFDMSPHTWRRNFWIWIISCQTFHLSCEYEQVSFHAQFCLKRGAKANKQLNPKSYTA